MNDNSVGHRLVLVVGIDMDLVARRAGFHFKFTIVEEVHSHPFYIHRQKSRS